MLGNVSSTLKGKTIIFLGSSVTYGSAAGGQSFVELFETLDGVKAVKEAVSGTTLADTAARSGDGGSYVSRLKRLDTGMKADCVVVQLSTNDASKKLPLGYIRDSTELSSFDTQTVTGAMEWIICYSRGIWDCPVVFYTGARYDSPEYAAMVSRLMELQSKWGIGVIDLYTDDAFNDIEGKSYARYMSDPIHPTRAGYAEWWFPKMEADLTSILEQQTMTEKTKYMDSDKYFKLEIFIPETHFSKLRKALQSVDAGHIGSYDCCLSYSRVIGTWRPLPGTNPFIGEEGVISEEEELKVEVTVTGGRLDETIDAIKAVHPYEEPVINVIELYRTGV